MSQPIRTFSVTAPGFMGLNTQDSGVDMDSKFALEANNCVIDKFGRVGARKGWTTAHTTLAALGSANVESIGELIAADGSHTIIAAGNNKIFKLSGTTLVELTYGGGGSAPAITASNWQCAGLISGLIMFQEGYDPICYDPTVSATTYRRVSEHAGAAGTPPKANCGISAYGRLWAARTDTDKNTVYWSDTLTDHKWSGGSSGSLNLHGVWPQGGDEIIGLAAHNNQLIIFGSRQTLIYTGARDPSTMTLYDAIGNCGCVGRDTIQNTPSDVVFLSAGGVRALSRTIQEKSAPIATVSRSVNDDILGYTNNETSGATIKSVYSPADSFYLLTFQDSLITYCFDMRSPLPDGSSRVTTWSGIAPKTYCYSIDRVLYMGQPGYIGKYEGYYDNSSSYRMTYYTSWVDFGDPIRTSILKKINMTVLGVSDQAIIYKWGFDYVPAIGSQTVNITDVITVASYGLTEYGVAEYNRNLVIDSISANAGGSGKVVQIGMECNVIGYPISVQRVDVYTKDGAYK
jgi:hypothetical protein